MIRAHSSWLRVVWARSATGRALGLGHRAARSTSSSDWTSTDRLGRDGHGPDRLLVALVADVEDGVALAGPHLELVVDLGHERADGVDHHPAVVPGGGHDLWRGAVGGEHQRRAGGDLVDVVDEDHAPGPELVDHVPVVDDLVVAVHGRLEDPHHPGERLDGHLDAGAEAPGRGQQHTVDRHDPRLPGPSARADRISRRQATQ